jgi:hypothetical protein
MRVLQPFLELFDVFNQAIKAALAMAVDLATSARSALISLVFLFIPKTRTYLFVRVLMRFVYFSPFESCWASRASTRPPPSPM